jgi:hypothetical protein
MNFQLTNLKGVNMANKLFIKEDITDWQEEAFRDETIIESEEDIFDLLDKGSHTAKLARATVVSRQMGKAPEDIIRPNKILVQVGAMLDISSMASRKYRDFELKDGRTIRVHEYVGAVRERSDGDDAGDSSEDESSYVKAGTAKALDRAERFLLTIVIGHIYNRLATILDYGGDVRLYADELKKKIDEVVDGMV